MADDGVAGEVVEASYDARKASEVAAVDALGRSRRRHWHPQQKLAIVQESIASGLGPMAVARRYGISSGLLYTWRRQLLAAATEGFVPLEIVAEPKALAAPAPVPALAAPDPATAAGAIEVELPGGAKLRVGAGADVGALGAILAALAPK